MNNRFNDVVAWSVAMRRHYNYQSKVCREETQHYYKKMAEIYSIIPTILARFEKDFDSGRACFDCEYMEERGDDD